MYTVKMIEHNDQQEITTWYQCLSIRKHRAKTDSKDDFVHRLSLDGICGDRSDGLDIDLYNMPEDKGGVYHREIFIMNEQGQTIDRIGGLTR